MPLHEQIYASATSERSAILDNYSNQLSKRDEALDRREYLLKKREKELDEKLEKCKEHGRDIEMMRGAVYQEKSAFLQKAEKREEELKELEANQRAVAANLEERMAIVNDLLETSKKTAAELRDKRVELRSVNEQLMHMHSTLRTARDTMETLKIKSDQTSVRERRCAEIVVSLDNRKTELDSLQSRLQQLQTDVAQRERNMADRLSEAAVVLPVKRILPDLRKIATEYNDFRQSVRGSDEMRPEPVPVDDRLTLEEQVHMLQMFFQDLRTHARAMIVRENSCSMKENTLTERERSLANTESSISSREQTVREAERRLSLRSKEIESQMNEAKAMLQRSEESIRRIAQQEERVYSRESAVQERETLLKEKESHSDAREESLKRAGEAIKAHEATNANEVRKVEEIRLRLESLESNVNAREALLKTKEVELSVREAAAAVKTRQTLREIPHIAGRVAGAQAVPEVPTSPEAVTGESAAQAGARASVPSLNITGASDVHPVSQRSERHDGSSAAASDNHEVDVNQPPNIEVDAENPGSAMPSTVRKQLTFGFTPSNLMGGVNQDQAGPPNLEAASDRSKGSDADSEQAAEQLHDELKAARGLWIEKVNRLDTVVASMSADLTTTGTQLLPVIRNVRAELQRIRAQALEEPQKVSSPASEAFAMEQQRHRDWALSMTAQLNTIREVQAGLLHAFHRVLPSTTRRDRDLFFGRRREMSEDPQIEHLQPLRIEDTERENVDSNSGGRSSGDTNTDEMLRKLIPMKPKRKHRKYSRRRNNLSGETSITDNSNEHKQFNVTVAGWSNFRPLARLPLTPLGTSDELDALRRELGLDPACR